MSKLTTLLNYNDHRFGNPDAPVNLVKYGDYECPGCKRAHVLIKRLLQERSDDLNFVFRHFPLRDHHAHAYSAAIAAEAARQQNKFWSMHDLIFENQKRLNDQVYLQLAEDLGLDIGRFTTDLTSEEVHDKVTSDFEGGIRSGVAGTPTFFINGSSVLISNGIYDSLSKAVMLQLKSKQLNRLR